METVLPSRENLQQLLEGLQRENLHTMLSCEVISRPEQVSTLEIAEFLSDTVIALASERKYSGISRSLEITKSRGQDYDYGKHTLVIGAKGPEVFRRVQAPPRGPEAQPTSSTKRSVIGWDPLDDLMGGGIFDGSTTMVVGVSGVGKTILGVQVLLEGAIKQGKKGLMVSLDEHPAQIIRNAETLGLKLGEQVEKGNIIILFESPQELELNVHFHRIVRALEEHGCERLLIDGMTSYSTAVGNERDFFHSLVGYVKHNLIAAFFSYETPELFGLSSFMPEFGVSSVVDNIILMNIIELGNTLHRAMTVAKARGTSHQFDSREFTIGQGGINLLPLDESQRLPVLPFASYYNILSRAPTRISPRIHNEPLAEV